ncbi:SDR family oxidoreductase [Streptomyces sp. ISL-11]|uniref:SDR family oxidoreductase n=1 Tax=Streptomyces sp. ISL-11 TaxID=2819174 RepID=UPI001BE73F55|nr:SDR family oxidoreductase [Streptomyces sp. ISL-11]MBT2385286.1 SDR family oxidoreductase [Streptomyces sp. ISL-11]
MTAISRPEQLIAVVGMGVAVPGASSPGEVWRLLNGTRDVFSEPGDRFELANFWSSDPQVVDRTYARRAGYLHDLRPHPALREAEEKDGGPCRDQAVRWLRHAVLQAREDVRLSPRDRCGAYIGAWPGGSQSLVQAMLVNTLSRAAAADGEGSDEVRTALMEHYRNAVPLREAAPDRAVRAALTGITEQVVESVVVDTACASSLYAVDLGAKALLAGDCEVAYCGGFHVLDPTASVMFSKLSGLSKADRVRAFSASADGTVFSDGSAVVALKTLERAVADKDTIHGVLVGFGAAADGRGKSISAPNTSGQRRAIQRARSVSGVHAETVDWIIAHGTGTPAGDVVESEAITALGSPEGQLCSSNKPVFGHTGWVAGAFSLIHALLALRSQWVPGQLGAPEPEKATDTPGLRVPHSPIPFPSKPEGGRTVGISAFGFGGTNAHLLVTDRPDGTELRSQPPSLPDAGSLVLVGWSAQVPGGPSPTRIQEWLRGTAPEVDARFPDPYPAPGPAEVRLSGRTVSAVDPCQLMALQVAARFVEAHGEMWASLRESTGVIAAHTGFPSKLTSTAMRCYAADVTGVLERYGDRPAFERAAREVEKIRQKFPACTEDSQAGVMPNVIASRIAARYDLHGPTMAIDAGVDSSLMALKTAHRYLRTGELELALVLAVNGNSTPENGALFGQGAATLAEGAFLLALASARSAERHHWPVLARLSFGAGQEPPGGRGPGVRTRSYLAADHVVGLLRAVETGALPCPLSDERNVTVVTVEPSSPGDAARAAPRPRWLTTRYAKELTLRPATAEAGSLVQARPRLPRRGVVLLGCAETGAPIRSDLEDADAVVVTVPDVNGIDELREPASLDRRFPGLATAAPHLTVICEVGEGDLRRCLAVHDMLFLVTQRLWSRWRTDSSLVVLLTGIKAGTFHNPLTALFTGFVKSLRWEKPGTAALVIATDEPLTQGLLVRAGRELTARPAPVPIVYYFRGERRIETLHPAPLPSLASSPQLPIHDTSIGVVTGGVGGITQCLLTALSEHVRPKLWLLGRTSDLPVPPDVLAVSDDRLPHLRSRLLHRVRETHPGLPPRQVVGRVDALLKARNVHRAVHDLKSRFGADRVEYISCDIRDPAAVDQAMGRVLRCDGRVDFVIHAAGQVASTLLANKNLDTFRRVRDTKVLGHHNVTSALRDHPPALWCNIGSHSAVAGIPGDTDYAAGNAYLEGTAELLGPTPEITIGFGMWAQAGMGADPVLQEQIAREALFTPIPTAEGTAQFISELGTAALLGGTSTYLGKHERERLRKHDPALVHQGPPDPRLCRQRPPWVTNHTSPSQRSASWDMDARDSYLFDHLVHGKPTVPATFMLDIAAHAAESLVPGTVTQGFRHAEFETFIRPFNRRKPTPLRVKARLLAGTDHTEQPIAVEVSIHSDTLAPDGRLRHGALRNFHTQVLLARGHLPAPRRWRPPETSGTTPAVDPYAGDDGPVSLRGIFRNLSHCQVAADSAHGTWTPRLVSRPYLRSATTAPLLTCASLRTAALRPDASGKQPLLIPRSIERLDLYTEGANDRELLARYGHTLVVSVDRDGTYRACTADDRLLLEISSVQALDMSGASR